MAERVGHVSEIQPPAEGKKMYSAKIGGRAVRFYGTGFDSEDPSAVLIALRDAVNRGMPVRAVGSEFGSDPARQSFKVTEVAIVDSVPDAPTQNGSAAPPTFHGGKSTEERRSIVSQTAHKAAAALLQAGVIAAGDGKQKISAAVDTLSATAAAIIDSIGAHADPKPTEPDKPVGSDW